MAEGPHTEAKVILVANLAYSADESTSLVKKTAADERTIELVSSLYPKDLKRDEGVHVPEPVRNFKELKEKLKTHDGHKLMHFRVQRQICKCSNYYHHFIVVDVSITVEGIHALVVHYTKSENYCYETNDFGVCKMKGQRVMIKPDECYKGRLFDVEAGLELVQHSSYPQNKSELFEARARLFDRIGEREYDFSWNNCEHAALYILTGKSKSTQSDAYPRKTVCCGILLRLKEQSLVTPFLISLISAAAGSLVRYTYVVLIVVAFFFHHAGKGTKQICSNTLGKKFISEAKTAITDTMKISSIKEIPHADGNITAFTSWLDNSEICKEAEDQARTALWKTFVYSVVCSIMLEIIFVYDYIWHSLLPLGNTVLKYRKKLFKRIDCNSYSQIAHNKHSGSCLWRSGSIPPEPSCILVFRICLNHKHIDPILLQKFN